MKFTVKIINTQEILNISIYLVYNSFYKGGYLNKNIEDDLLAKERFIKILKGTFPSQSIITLGEIVKKIAVVSKVRVGNDLTWNDYDEVTPTKLDAYGILIPHRKGKDLGPANKNLLESQNLNPGDLLISYRGSKHYSVGRAGDNYMRKTIGNNGAIRIQFDEEVNKEIPVMLQSFLNLQYVQEYLLSVAQVSSESKYPRKILTSQILLELPIPKFEVQYNNSYKNKYEKNLELINTLDNISQFTTQLKSKLEKNVAKQLENYLADYTNSDSDNETHDKQMEASLNMLEMNLKQLELIIKE